MTAIASASDFVAALQRRDPAAAVRVAQRLLHEAAPLGDQWAAVARFAAAQGEWTLACDAMARLVAAAPTAIDRRVAQAGMLASAGRLSSAIAAIDQLPEAAADPRGGHLLGTAWLQLGDTDRGISALQAAVDAMPESGLSWLALAHARRWQADDAMLASLARAREAIAGSSVESQAAYDYARAKLFDDQGDTERAFAAITAGAAKARSVRRFDAAADMAEARAIVATHGAGWMATPPSAAARADPGPAIFVTGIPRSGTTLIQEILASHSAVVGGDELNLLARAASWHTAGQPDRHPHAVLATPEARSAFAARYRYLVEQRFDARGLVVDKSLNTPRLAQLVRAGFADAPLLWLRRDPLDTAWSCYRTFFASGLGWSFDLADLGRHMAAEDLLFEHWRDHYGPRLKVVDYARFVADGAAGIAALLDHVRLSMEPQVATFHDSARAVTTASVHQVRQPINRAGIGSARRYAHHLEPFSEAYAHARRALGLPA